ncbi:Fucose 4-O-acetylase [Shimia gijangensis]|uniref:Fucose 4-O-acetylase n=2 Tax=Shimia gijangensis TaxID=1470563 RepID=A0A1M6IJ51_9RHOB|nr:Fucose 4-O-acetylase [Shimia gijangensis]
MIRGALIVLVVWGHLLELNGFNGRLYFAIYLFHIPAFTMISGMFSKSRLDAKDISRMCRRLVLPLVIFQVLYFVVLDQVLPHRVFGLLTPVWIIWFLFSLVTWKLLLPLALRLSHPVLVAFFVALIAGFMDDIGREFSLSRTLVFFPAFLIGHIYGERILSAAIRHRAVLIGLFVVLVCAAFVAADHVNIRWLWGSHPYVRIPQDTPGVFFRAVSIVLGIVASVAFFAVVPARSSSLARLGRHTMPVFLLHGFPVIFFWLSGLQLGQSLLFASATAVTALAISISIAWGAQLWSAMCSS